MPIGFMVVFKLKRQNYPHLNNPPFSSGHHRQPPSTARHSSLQPTTSNPMSTSGITEVVFITTKPHLEKRHLLSYTCHLCRATVDCKTTTTQRQQVASSSSSHVSHDLSVIFSDLFFVSRN